MVARPFFVFAYQLISSNPVFWLAKRLPRHTWPSTPRFSNCSLCLRSGMEKVWIPLSGQRCSRNLVSASGELKAVRVSALGGAGVALAVAGGVAAFLLQAAEAQNIRSKNNRSILFILTRLVSRDS